MRFSNLLYITRETFPKTSGVPSVCTRDAITIISKGVNSLSLLQSISFVADTNLFSIAESISSPSTLLLKEYWAG